ncbi:alpha-amylase family protein [Saccharothrix syringae]|uniref:Alpha-amylase n=1 Tax=Saccharothrix syringae TaxID=103733 RepID=A0A5Q0H1C9_SACSY|nr:alpha-amylase [Saccharothrix syringae]QFZ19644.1 alpha-amylase [Saccharothrix syringae]
MTGWPARPVVYEVNTAAWLAGLSRAAGRAVTLGDVPEDEWDAVARPGVDAVWLMGVWERSRAGLDLVDADTRASLREALPDLREEDVVGSPYCVRRYVADAALGGPAGLAAARSALAERGARLVLDYVPNHVAPDHPWVAQCPEAFVRGDRDDLVADPAAWLVVGDQVLARGRDPYFPPWPDVVQLDAFSPAARAAAVEALTDIADQCDGIRCDMAMLPTNEVFARTWGDRAGPAPAEDFWPAVLAAVRDRHPGVVLIGEVYWDMEWALRQQGFDYCYDKRLYDRLVGLDPGGVRDHLRADVDHQDHLLRFLENHDEPRVAERLPREAGRAAAVAVATLPGATLWHEGQFEGRRTRLPVFLRRAPGEPVDRELAEWYDELVFTVASEEVRTGTWRLAEPRGWPDNQTHHNVLAWSWTALGGRRHLVVVNLSGTPSQARVPLPWSDLRGHRHGLTELLREETFYRDGDELADEGLFVSLPPWHHHLLGVARE